MNGTLGSEKQVRTYYQRFFEGEIEEVLSSLSANIVHQFNQADPSQGLEKFQEFVEKKRHDFQESMEELTVFTEPTGTKAAAQVLVRGVYRVTRPGLPPASQQPYLVRVGAFFEFEKEKISRLTTYYSVRDWYRQIGAPLP